MGTTTRHDTQPTPRQIAEARVQLAAMARRYWLFRQEAKQRGDLNSDRELRKLRNVHAAGEAPERVMVAALDSGQLTADEVHDTTTLHRAQVEAFGTNTPTITRDEFEQLARHDYAGRHPSVSMENRRHGLTLIIRDRISPGYWRLTNDPRTGGTVRESVRVEG